MKSLTVYRLVIVIIFILLIVGCSNGKQDSEDENLVDHVQTLGKSQKIEVISVADGTVVRTLTEEKEIATFIEKQRMDEWEFASTLPNYAEENYEYHFFQEETKKIAEKEKENRSLQRVATLTTYKNIPYVTLKVAFIEVTIKIPEDVEEFLNKE